MNKPLDAGATAAQAETPASTLSRGKFLKGAAATAAAVATTGLLTESARAARPTATPNVNLGTSISGDVYLWDAQPLYTTQQIAAFNAVYPERQGPREDHSVLAQNP